MMRCFLPEYFLMAVSTGLMQNVLKGDLVKGPIM